MSADLTATLLAANLLLSALLPAQGQTATKSTREAQLEDLETARTEYVLKSKAFTSERRERALQLIESLRARAGTLSNPEFFVGIGEIVALADNAHDGSAKPGDRAWTSSKRLPLHMIYFPDGLMVARAAREQGGLLGARVISIESLAPNEMFSRLCVLSGGTNNYRSWDAMWAIEWSDRRIRTALRGKRPNATCLTWLVASLEIGFDPALE